MADAPKVAPRLREENEWWDKYARWTDFTYNVFLYDGLFDNSSLQHYSERVGAQNPLIARERAHDIAEIYRALRKSREDSKDEPGAADFYYGEMEMRRKAAGFSVEGILLAAYWLLSGYGLRAWRAVTAVVVMLTFATTLFAVPRTTTAPQARAEHPVSTRVANASVTPATVRRWAHEQGIQVADRGRIPKSVTTQYLAQVARLAAGGRRPSRASSSKATRRSSGRSRSPAA